MHALRRMETEALDMTAQPKGEIDGIVFEEITILERLHALLQNEQSALSILDYLEIERISEEKLSIEQKLRELASLREQSQGELSETTKGAYDRIVESIKQVWEANNARFKISLDILESLTDVLTGIQRPSYGPRSSASYLQTASPVLTNEVG